MMDPMRARDVGKRDELPFMLHIQADCKYEDGVDPELSVFEGVPNFHSLWQLLKACLVTRWNASHATVWLSDNSIL
jgi:hypothetical protein